ncbi:hypothetical protein X963_4970 [Burkholderia pseudomallei MSHR7498]|nr:hypothetical protein DP56_5782 [Burkholderia pseudomallei]KGR98513.1 hypothetical protein X977_5127 [Burkholderia pseudomallei MSHR7504]KGS92775.1 hypothetical protein X963_4970 [Burkholderia pseudomallei MSHR7498]KOS85133.1 hypothetical protein DM45_2646 [Burkholderia mallei]VUD51037.1 hypothetical protein UKMH10_2336 [Burkholderia pseudomallei]
MTFARRRVPWPQARRFRAPLRLASCAPPNLRSNA